MRSLPLNGDCDVPGANEQAVAPRGTGTGGAVDPPIRRPQQAIFESALTR